MKSKLVTLFITLAITATIIISTAFTVKATSESYNGNSIDVALNATSTPDYLALS